MENGDIPDNSIQAIHETTYNRSGVTRMAKDGRLNGASGWSPAGNLGPNENPWIQADIGNYGYFDFGT